jgi:hypothetical protein
MPMLTPPPLPPWPALGDAGHHRRLRLRLTQILTTVVTVLVTVWLCMLGPIPGLIGMLFAKHILVAVLLMGLGMGDVRLGPGRTSPFS